MLDSTFRAERAKTRQANKASYMEITTSITSQGTIYHTHKREKGTNMLTAPEIDYFIAIPQRGKEPIIPRPVCLYISNTLCF